MAQRFSAGIRMKIGTQVRETDDRLLQFGNLRNYAARFAGLRLSHHLWPQRWSAGLAILISSAIGDD